MPMHRVPAFAVIISLVPAIGLAQTRDDEPGFIDSLKNDVLADFRHHYSRRPLTNVATGLAVGGIIANSDADEEIQQFFRDNLVSNAGDDLANLFTGVGDVAQPLYSFPIYLGAMWLGGYNGARETAAASWGANSMRAALVGAPELVILSHLTGGQRPEAGEPGWDPFHDDNGVSGHAFFGAVPIITAANLTDKRWLRNFLFATSVFPGLARVYEDKHYFSQSFLGWWLAYLATKTVAQANRDEEAAVEISPFNYADGGGLQLTVTF